MGSEARLPANLMVDSSAVSEGSTGVQRPLTGLGAKELHASNSSWLVTNKSRFSHRKTPWWQLMVWKKAL